MKTWKKIVLLVLFLLLVVWGVFESFTMHSTEAAPTATKGSAQVSAGLVKEAPAKCECVQKPVLKRKVIRRKITKRPPAVVAKKVPQKSLPAVVTEKAVVTPAPQKLVVVAKANPAPTVTKSFLDNVDVDYAKRKAAAQPKIEAAGSKTVVVVLRQPAKFYPVLPSGWQTCQHNYNGYTYCDNNGYVQTNNYAPPYTPASTRFQPVAVPQRQVVVPAPSIRTAPVAVANPPGIGTR